jgi:hypothetical protein
MIYYKMGDQKDDLPVSKPFVSRKLPVPVPPYLMDDGGFQDTHEYLYNLRKK